MVTFHPTARPHKASGRYAAMVIIRNPKGQCVGSRVSERTYPTKELAAAWARLAALRVQSEDRFLMCSRVA